MTATRDKITDADLMAWLDGELAGDPARLAAIEAHLAAHPEVRSKLDDYKKNDEAITALFGPVTEEIVPHRLSPHRISSNESRRARTGWQLAAAAMVLLTLGGLMGWFARDYDVSGSDTAGSLIAEAIDAHDLFVIQKAHPVEVTAEQSEHLTNWLSNSLDRRLVMPDLSSAGYALVGGRLLPSGPVPAAQIMYQNAEGARVTLFITPHQPGEPLAQRLVAKGPLAALYWANGAIDCTIVGPLEQDEMKTLAQAVVAALSPDAYRRT